MKFLSSPWIKRIQSFFVILILVSIVIVLIESWEQIRQIEWRVNLLILGLSLVIIIVSVLFWATIWSWTLQKSTGGSNQLHTLISIYLYSNTAKYLPGSLWNQITRGYLGYQKGFGVLQIWGLSLMELLLSISSGFLLYLISLLFSDQETSYINFSLLIIVILISWVIFSPPILQLINKLIAHIKNPTSAQNSIPILNWYEYITFLSASIFSWTVVGIAFYIFVISIFPISYQFMVEIIGVWSLAIALGLAAIGIPQGIGIREGLLAVALSRLVPFPIALSISILSRFWIIIGELTAIALWWLFSKLCENTTHNIR